MNSCLVCGILLQVEKKHVTFRRPLEYGQDIRLYNTTKPIKGRAWQVAGRAPYRRPRPLEKTGLGVRNLAEI